MSWLYSRFRGAARPLVSIYAEFRGLKCCYLVGMLCAAGNEIPDKSDGHLEISALLQKMLPGVGVR